jgi:hypothetical protein
MTKQQLLDFIENQITDPLNHQNTASVVRSVLNTIVEDCYNGDGGSDVSFDWDRPITRTTWPVGLTLGGTNIKQGLEKAFFAPLPSSLSMVSFNLQELGTSYIPNISGTVVWNGGIVSNKRIERNGVVINNPVSDNISYNDIAMTTTTVYSIKADSTLITMEGTAGTLTQSRTLTFIAPMYYGVGVTGLVGQGLKDNLTKQIEAKAAKLRSFTVNPNQVYYLAYPASWGNLTSIKDINGFEVINDFTRTDKNINLANGVVHTYKVYEFKYPQVVTKTTSFNFIF